MSENRVDAAREFYEKKFPRFPTNDTYTFEVFAEFAEQQIALAVAEAVKAEREQITEAIIGLEEGWTHSEGYARACTSIFNLIKAREFAKEIGGTDGR